MTSAALSRRMVVTLVVLSAAGAVGWLAVGSALGAPMMVSVMGGANHAPAMTGPMPSMGSDPAATPNMGTPQHNGGGCGGHGGGW